MRFDCIHCRKATTKPQSVKGAFLRMLTNEQTARYLEYNNRGEGADISRRVSWAKVLTRDEADRIKIDVVFPDLKEWSSYYSGK